MKKACMKTNLIYMLIITITLNILQIHTMDNETELQAILLDNHSGYHSLNNENKQTLSNDAIRLFTANLPYRQKLLLKTVSKQFCKVLAINELSYFVTINHFVIGEEKDREIIFTDIINTKNSQLLKAILQHAEKEASRDFQAQLDYQDQKEEVITINMEDADHYKQEFIDRLYLTPLSEEAIKNKNDTMIQELKKITQENALTTVDIEAIKYKIWREKFFKVINTISCVTRYTCGTIIVGAVLSGLLTFMFLETTSCNNSNSTKPCLE